MILFWPSSTEAVLWSKSGSDGRKALIMASPWIRGGDFYKFCMIFHVTEKRLLTETTSLGEPWHIWKSFSTKLEGSADEFDSLDSTMVCFAVDILLVSVSWYCYFASGYFMFAKEKWNRLSDFFWKVSGTFCPWILGAITKTKIVSCHLSHSFIYKMGLFRIVHVLFVET